MIIKLISRPSYFLLSTFYFLLLFSSCTSTNSPRPVAEKFLDAYQHRDFAEAKKYSTKETVKLLQVLERISKEDSTQQALPHNIEVISEEIAGDKATVYFKEEGDDAEQKLMMRKMKIEGETEKQWRVLLTKEDAHFSKDLKMAQ